MVSPCVMGWGLVLMENSSVVAAVAVATVTAAAVAAAAVAVGVDPKKVGFSFKHIGYGHFFKGVFSENTLHTFSRFWQFPKGGHLSKIPTII